MSRAIETKFIGGTVIQTKQEDRNGVPIGIVEGYIATWDIDRGDWFGTKDQFVKGAFISSIMNHKQKNRQIRLKDHHGRTVGGFPIDSVKEDERGLFGVGEINLDVQQGKEAFALAKQGVLSDFSIGFSIDESSLDEQNYLRTITKATIWEGSIVDEPMNPQANITAVKNMNKFQDLPLAPKETEWDMEKAFENVDKFANESAETMKAVFNKVFLQERVLNTLIADVIDGSLVAIPKALNSVSKYVEKMEESKLKDEAINHLEKYFAKMDVKSPFAEEEKQFFNIEEVKVFTQRDFEKALSKSGSFSKEAAKFIVSQTNFKKEIEKADAGAQKLIDELNSIKEFVQKK